MAGVTLLLQRTADEHACCFPLQYAQRKLFVRADIDSRDDAYR